MLSNYLPFYVLNTLAILIELVFDMSKFIIINTAVLSLLLYEATMGVDWVKYRNILNNYRNAIGEAFVYRSEGIQ